MHGSTVNSVLCRCKSFTSLKPKYIDDKSHWYTIKREDNQPFTVAAIYDDAVIRDSKVRSFSMLTINSDNHPL